MPLIKNDKSEWVNFIHIPKTGGSSIEDEIKSKYQCIFMPSSNRNIYIDGVSQQHMDRHTINMLGVNYLYDASFAIIRNPIDRFISEYKYRRKSKIFSLIFNINTFTHYALRKYSKNDSIFDGHIKPQHLYICSETKVMKLESGMDKIINSLNEDFDISQLNVSHKNKSKNTEVYLGRTSYKNIEMFYKKDIEIFNYHIDIEKYNITNCKPSMFKSYIAGFCYELLCFLSVIRKLFNSRTLEQPYVLYR